ncbi:uncharacterized protein LOC130665637 [Microplitis mediator]|uniref:uncharacterized protein LOC130665637 n=1 Tax=Microplitis mediator TaxID=375433 RepID=UPI002554CD52|nr:uncharacterized protein LOC130665637 [Microplitis mediator]
MLKFSDSIKRKNNDNEISLDDDVIIMQKPQNTRDSELSSENFKVYIGLKPYTVMYNSNEVNKLMQYIHHIIDYAWNYIETSRFTNLIDNVWHVAINMVSTILKFNNFTGIDKCKVLITENSVLLSEPIVITLNNPSMTSNLSDNVNDSSVMSLETQSQSQSGLQQPCVMVSRKLLRECCKINQLPQIKFDDNTRLENLEEHVINCAYEHVREVPLQEELLQLLVAADHAANHFMEELTYQKTDYINHKNFARSFYTLHSKINIQCKMNAKHLPLNLLARSDYYV